MFRHKSIHLYAMVRKMYIIRILDWNLEIFVQFVCSLIYDENPVDTISASN